MAKLISTPRSSSVNPEPLPWHRAHLMFFPSYVSNAHQWAVAMLAIANSVRPEIIRQKAVVNYDWHLALPFERLELSIDAAAGSISIGERGRDIACWDGPSGPVSSVSDAQPSFDLALTDMRASRGASLETPRDDFLKEFDEQVVPVALSLQSRLRELFNDAARSGICELQARFNSIAMPFSRVELDEMRHLRFATDGREGDFDNMLDEGKTDNGERFYSFSVRPIFCQKVGETKKSQAMPRKVPSPKDRRERYDWKAIDHLFRVEYAKMKSKPIKTKTELRLTVETILGDKSPKKTILADRISKLFPDF